MALPNMSRFANALAALRVFQGNVILYRANASAFTCQRRGQGTTTTKRAFPNRQRAPSGSLCLPNAPTGTFRTQLDC